MTQVSFYGAAGEVTGSCYLLEREQEKILIDCGLFQCPKFCDSRSRDPFPFNPKEISALVVTHAHIDHTGRIPKLIKEGFEGKIYSTHPTRDLAELMLTDSMGVLLKESRMHNTPLLYSEEDIGQAMKAWEGKSYHETFSIGSFQITLYRSGHILGSTMTHIEYERKSILFTGDLGSPDNPLIERDENIPSPDSLVVDATYGDRLHESAQERTVALERAIERSVMRGGVLMIPAFSLERTQELIWEISRMLEGRQIPRIPIFIDSPLAIKATKIYQRYFSYLKKAFAEEKNFSFLSAPSVRFTNTTEESKEINNIPSPKIIIAGSGMSTGGRILHHERRYLQDPKSTILFVGYQAAGSLGRVIQDGASSVELFGEEIPVRCHREVINGYSGHADQEGILQFITDHSEKIRTVYAAHAEPKASLALAQKIRDNLGIHAIAPKYGESVIV